jgi:hypothetical protein
LRVCQNCFSSKNNQSRPNENPTSSINVLDTAISLPLTANNINKLNENVVNNENDDDDEDDDPDINFEVRSEKLNLSSYNLAEQSDETDDQLNKRINNNEHVTKSDLNHDKGTYNDRF